MDESKLQDSILTLLETIETLLHEVRQKLEEDNTRGDGSSDYK